MNGHEQAMHMKDGERVDEYIAGLEAPVVLERDGIAQQVAVRQHGPLAAARGAAGVQNGGEVIHPLVNRLVNVGMGRGTIEQAARAVVAQCEDMLRARLEGDLGHPAKVARRAHHHSGLGVAHKVFNLAALVGGIERQKHIARAQRGQIQQHRLDRLFDLHRHAAARRQLQ